MAVGNMKAIKRRIKSVSSTMQITKAMEMVASSKLRRAKKKEKETLPFFLAQQELLKSIYNSNNIETKFAPNPAREVKNSLYIVIAGDKGLAGGYNSNVFKKVKAVHEESGKPDLKAIAIGKKAVDFFEKQETHELIVERPGIAENIKSGHCTEIVDEAIKLFLNGEVDEVKLIYTRFVSSMIQETEVMQLLPLQISRDGDGNSELLLKGKPGERDSVSTGDSLAKSESDSDKKPIDPDFDPTPEAVFNRVVPQALSGIVQCAITESYTSELCARQMAMESASDNAADMIDNLSLVYNRARQEKITNEINEIVGGANAL
ncbi:MAG: ATP synthase F1 subunit gamma [Oscillospiraceae bacterium]|nr:ATP synthase F1 subunit gamma [Oscillospiraceae bacterium]